MGTTRFTWVTATMSATPATATMTSAATATTTTSTPGLAQTFWMAERGTTRLSFALAHRLTWIRPTGTAATT